MNAEELFEINIKKLTEKELFFCSETIEYVQSGHIEQPCIGDNKSETIDVQHIFLLANEMDIEKILKAEEENDVYSGMLHKKHEGIPMLPLYLYYDRQQFECMISSYDMTKLCEIYRIVILVGRDALINFFCEMDTLMPNMILGDRVFAITNIIDNIYKNKLLLDMEDILSNVDENFITEVSNIFLKIKNNMGIWNSFKGQVGRDTGKVVSNLIWKDKHASVYRRAEDRKQEALKLKKKQLEAELEQKQLDREYEAEKDERIYIEKLKNRVENKVREIDDIEIPEDRKQQILLMNRLILLFKSNPFKDDGESDITNAYPEAILTKYEHTLMMFETLYSDDEKIEYYRRQLGAMKKQKMRG